MCFISNHDRTIFPKVKYSSKHSKHVECRHVVSGLVVLGLGPAQQGGEARRWCLAYPAAHAVGHELVARVVDQLAETIRAPLVQLAAEPAAGGCGGCLLHLVIHLLLWWLLNI